MSRAITSTFFKTFFHGLDVILSKVEHVFTHGRANLKSDPSMASAHCDLVNLPYIAEQLAANHEGSAGARSIHLSVDIAPDALVVGDSSELHRAMEQLVTIAIENTPSGGRVIVTGTESNGEVILTFRSLKPSDLSEAFLQFQPGSTSTASDFLLPALYIVPNDVGQIVKAHGGRLNVSSRTEFVSRLEVRLPVGRTLSKHGDGFSHKNQRSSRKFDQINKKSYDNAP